MRNMIVLAALTAGAALFVTSASAQTRASVWDGVYTDAQAARGATQYLAHCSICHDAALAGNGEAPPLVGRFIPDWEGTTLADLFEKISVTMPLNRPGSVSATDNADILAYILKANNFPAGANELGSTSDALGAISFDASKPMPAASPKPMKGKPAPR